MAYLQRQSPLGSLTIGSWGEGKNRVENFRLIGDAVSAEVDDDFAAYVAATNDNVRVIPSQKEAAKASADAVVNQPDAVPLPSDQNTTPVGSPTPTEQAAAIRANQQTGGAQGKKGG